MSDVRTIDPPETSRTDRAVRRRRGLPGGRAVVGAFLIAVAAVGVFAAYLDATAAPTTRYLVATTDIAPGTRLGDGNTRYVAIDLPAGQAANALAEGDVDGLPEALVTVSAVRSGELVQQSAVLRESAVEDRTRMSFALPSSRALGGALRANERVDVLATYQTQGGAYTMVVVRGIRVLGTEGGGGEALGGGGGTTITVELPTLALAQRLAHALDAADVYLVRSGAIDEDTPQDYRPEGGSIAPPPADDERQPASDGVTEPTPEPEPDPLAPPASDGGEAP